MEATKKKQYILKRGREYLSCVIPQRLAKMSYNACYTIYKYDAARIDDLGKAKSIVRKLAEDGEEWRIILFSPMTGSEETVWKTN